MQILGWILFAILLTWYFYSMKYNHLKRIHLENYIVYLLLNDEIRENHKKKFGDWIRESDARNAMDLSLRTQKTIENMSDNFSETSTLGAHAMLWNSEYASELRKKYKNKNT
jgi:hypothetical protein